VLTILGEGFNMLTILDEGVNVLTILGEGFNVLTILGEGCPLVHVTVPPLAGCGAQVQVRARHHAVLARRSV
jgi:hypothetical protein